MNINDFNAGLQTAIDWHKGEEAKATVNKEHMPIGYNLREFWFRIETYHQLSWTELYSMLKPQITEDTCPGHVSDGLNPKVCKLCGIHINSLRPQEEEQS